MSARVNGGTYKWFPFDKFSGGHVSSHFAAASVTSIFSWQLHLCSQMLWLTHPVHLLLCGLQGILKYIKIYIYIYIYSCITGKYCNTTIMYSNVQFILFNQILHTSIFNNWTSILYSTYCTDRKVLLPGITGIVRLPVVPLLTCSQFPFHCFQLNHLQKLPTPTVKFCFTYTYLQWLNFDF